jgi:hypothetical protein
VLCAALRLSAVPTAVGGRGRHLDGDAPDDEVAGRELDVEHRRVVERDPIGREVGRRADHDQRWAAAAAVDVPPRLGGADLRLTTLAVDRAVATIPELVPAHVISVEALL